MKKEKQIKFKAEITYKSVLTGYKSIKDRNEHFNSLDKQSQRMEIAWDALQLVIAEKTGANIRGFWSNNLMNVIYECSTSHEFQQKLRSSETFNNKCEVCARGAMMLSQIRLGNNIDPDDRNADCGDNRNIKGFSYDDFLEIENVFEYNYYNHPFDRKTDEKLANICCNILVNGNFNINDKKNYLSVEP